MNGVDRYADQEQLSTQPDPLYQSHQVETTAQGVGYLYEVISGWISEACGTCSEKSQTLLATYE